MMPFFDLPDEWDDEEWDFDDEGEYWEIGEDWDEYEWVDEEEDE